MKRLALAVGIVLVGYGSVNARAAVVAGWDVAGVDLDDGIGVETNIPPFSFNCTISETGNVSAKLVLGDGVNPTTYGDRYGFKISGSDQTNSLAGAIAKNHYMEFSIKVDDGYELNLGSIKMKGQASGTGCSNVVLMSSIDGFVAGNEIAAAHPANKTGGFDTDADGFGGPIDLTAARYQGLTGTVAFRIYGWDSTSGVGETHIRTFASVSDDLVVFGEVMMLAGDGLPTLSFTVSNDTAHVAAVFNEPAATNHVLQNCGNLVSNDWNTVSAPFSSDTNWVIQATNSAEYFRTIVQ